MADNARTFNGTSDQITSGDASALTIGGTGGFTLGMWLNFTSSGTDGRTAVVLGSNDGLLTRGIGFGIYGSNTAVTLRARVERIGKDNHAGSTVLSPGTWYRAGLTRSAGSGVQTHTLVLNGASDSTRAVDPITALASGDVWQWGAYQGDSYIGGWPGSLAWGFYLQGVVLTPTQLDAYLNNPQQLVTDFGASGAVTANALKLLYPMQCSAPTEVDKSVSGNDGTYAGTSITSSGPTPTTSWATVCGIARKVAAAVLSRAAVIRASRW